MKLHFFGVNSETVRGADYRTAKLERLEPLEEYGLPRDWNGGNAMAIAVMKFPKISLLVDSEYEVLDAFVEESNLDGLRKKELVDLAIKYDIDGYEKMTNAELAEAIKKH